MVMPTAFPNGATVRGSLVLPNGIPPTIGKVFYVDSTHASKSDSVGSGVSPDNPFATLDYAIGQCTANKGDVILLAPAHAENVATAAAIAVDVAGISIIGLGQGSNRPTFTFTGTAGTIAISAANVLISNVRVTSGIDEVVKMFHVTAANVTLDRVDHFETPTFQTIQFLLTTNAADFLTVQNCYHQQATAATAAQLWIQLVGCDNVRIIDNQFFLVLQNGATCATITATTAVLNCLIARNRIHQTGGTTQVSAILMVAASTGYAHDNRVVAAVTTLAGIIALASLYGAENYASHTVNKNGILDPVVDS
jgi:hypothetical protein